MIPLKKGTTHRLHDSTFFLRSCQQCLPPNVILPKQIFQTALILECKHSKSVKDLITDFREGAQQIIDYKYEEEIINEGYLHVKGYGISFYMKYCYIVKVQA